MSAAVPLISENFAWHHI